MVTSHRGYHCITDACASQKGDFEMIKSEVVDLAFCDEGGRLQCRSMLLSMCVACTFNGFYLLKLLFIFILQFQHVCTLTRCTLTGKGPTHS